MSVMRSDLIAMLAEADAFYERIRARDRHVFSELPGLLIKAEQAFGKIVERRTNSRDTEARQYNVFLLTHRAHFEVTTHQTVIADLLDPLGSHGQGNLFLRPFLHLVTECSGIDLAPPDGLWEVDHGLDYIDVRLRHPLTNDAVVIETKWNAGDISGQVIRYWENELKRTGKERIPVVFLTKDGRKPDLGAKGDQTRFNNDLVCMAFRKEFADLLRSSLHSVKALRVRETLAQYLDLITALRAAGEGGEEA
jgi:hypothetical protein